MRKTVYLRPLAATLMLSCAQAAHAQGIPATQVTVPNGNQQIEYFDSRNQTDFITVSNSDFSTPISYSSSFVDATTSAPYVPTVGAGARALVGDNATDARAALVYYIYVSGSDPTITNVPVDFMASLRVAAGGSDGNPIGFGNESSVATAEFFLQEYSASPELSNSYVAEIYDRTALAQTRFNSIGPNPYNLNIGDFVYVPTGSYLGVGIVADTSAQDGGNASASADPYFFIDPAFLADHPDYSLSFSPFVGNQAPSTGAVPEPASWAMMLVGFGAIGAGIRRRKQAVPHLG